MNPAFVLWVALSGVFLLTSCTSYEVQTEERVDKKLVKKEIQGLTAERVQKFNRDHLVLKLTQSGTKSFENTTYYSPKVVYVHDSYVKGVWDWHFPQAIPLIKMLLTVPALPLDLVAWIGTGPFTYISSSGANVEPYNRITTPKERFSEPVPILTKFNIDITGSTTPLSAQVKYNSSQIIVPLLSIARSSLKAGAPQATVSIKFNGNEKVKSSVKLSAEELALVLNRSITGTDAERLVKWNEVLIPCPKDATVARSEMERYVAPIRAREKRRLAEIARQERLRKEAEQRRLAEIARQEKLRKEREERERQARLAAERRAKELREARIANVKVIADLDKKLEDLKKLESLSKSEMRTAYSVEMQKARALKVGRYDPNDSRRSTEVWEARYGLLRAATIANELDDISALEAAASQIKLMKGTR